MVSKHGERITARFFTDYKDALNYYDDRCRNNPKNYEVSMVKTVNGKRTFLTSWKSMAVGTDTIYRNVAKDKTSGKKIPAPFGL